ncbi:MAG: hypothetical protein M3014_14910 [Chloroflexota bacterium]|nr:hypothetical protein [Chloroflexota bacterium]
MIGVLIFGVVLLIVDIAAWRWGANSNEGVDSQEWERRESWRGWHGKVVV